MKTKGEANRSAPRFESHALVEVKTSSWNPFSSHSAVLLDLSWGGFKIEFVSPVKSIRLGSKLKMKLPLSPFGILSPNHLDMTLIVRWFDIGECRCGGTFEKLAPDCSYILEKVVHFVSQKMDQKNR